MKDEKRDSTFIIGLVKSRLIFRSSRNAPTILTVVFFPPAEGTRACISLYLEHRRRAKRMLNLRRTIPLYLVYVSLSLSSFCLCTSREIDRI